MSGTTLRQQIWVEIKTAKTYAVCLQIYTDRQRKWNRCFPIIVGVLSFVGSITFPVSKYGTLITSIAVCLFSLLKIVLPILGQPEEELNQLDELYSYFGKKTQDFERVWNNYEDSQNNTDCQKALSEIKKDMPEHQSKMNKLVRHIWHWENSKVKKEVNSYLKSKYYPIDYGH